MPITVLSKTFSDEFNTGTTTELVDSNVGDEWTATINIEYSNIIDASNILGLNNGDFKWEAYTSGNIARTASGFQVFEPNQKLASFYTNEFAEMRNGAFAGASFDVSGFSGAIDGTYTIKEIVKGINSSGKVAIICNESFVAKKTAGSGRFAITEPLTAASIDYRATGTLTDSDYTPTIEINSSQSANFATETTTLDASSVSVITIPFKYNGAYQTGGLTIAGVSFTNDVQKFELVHTFRAVPISIHNTIDGVEPATFSGIGNTFYKNLFDVGGYASMKGAFSQRVSGGLAIPFNVPYSNDVTNFRTVGNKYIGGSTNYSISSLVMTRTSDSYVISTPVVEEKFTVAFNIDNVTDSPFSNSNTKVKVGIENLPETITNLEDYEQQFLSDYAIEVLGASAGTGNASGDALSISNYTATFTSTSQIAISFDVEFSANAITQIDLNSEPYFSIYVVTQNHTLDYTNSDRVKLDVFNGLGIQSVKVDPVTVNDTQFITAPYQDFTNGIDANEIDGFPVMLLTGSTQFSMDWTGRSALRLKKVSQSLVLKNSSTLEEIGLGATSIPVGSFDLIDKEYPDCNYSVQKGFKIPSTEVRNLIEMTNISNVSDVRTFEVFFPFFIRWEDYTENIMRAIPSTILDSAEPFDGKNYDVYRIDQLANWSLNYRVTFFCEEITRAVVNEFEQDFDYTIPTTTYNEHPDITARSIKSYKLDGTTELIDGTEKFIDNDANTLIVYESTLSTAPTYTTEFEIELWIEGYQQGSPTKIQRISSVNNILTGGGNNRVGSWWSDTGAGDGLVAKSIDGSKAVGKAYIDNQKLVAFDSYTIYGTFYNPTVPSNYKTTESGVAKITEDGTLKIIE